MKKAIFLLFMILWSCAQVVEVPPENLIEEETMADLIFELAVLDAAKGFIPKDQKDRIVLNADSFYQFHEIDSVQFAISNAYYAMHPKAYLRIVSIAQTKLEEFEKNIQEIETKILTIDSIDIKLKNQIKNITK